MKKAAIILLYLIMFGCASNSKKDAVAEAIRTYIEKNADDPASYEPLETTGYDTVMDKSNKTCAYVFIHSCRLKNKMGALVKEDYYVTTDANLKVYNMVTNRKQLYLNACDAIDYLNAEKKN